MNNQTRYPKNSALWFVKFIKAPKLIQLFGILAETERRGITFDQLLTIPEQDECVYNDGKSTTCVAFNLSIYKATGVFAPSPVPFK
ncbi:hypothetical protein PHJA_000169200 [Phtheirospermum japonicum]|uniref:Uncharacterized protein n=1 Tax=Phtheirospermum japonicum TaxID=374723 RepID=A0A830B5I0_9LAMI|nr:hypothetical protein PHJA_000169200 [Phtheirospermum japonicum]